MHLVKGILAYVVCTFVVQAISHFLIFKAHYAQMSFLRPEPIFALGVLAMIVQGAVLTFLYLRHASAGSSWGRGWRFGVLTGAFFVSYSVLAEPAKYTVPAIASWMTVEALTGLIQFSLFGLALGALFRKSTTAGTPPH